jgi:hypothetical protein
MIFNHVDTSRIVCTLPARSSLATSSPNSSICTNLSGSKSFDAFYRGLPVSERPVPGKHRNRPSGFQAIYLSGYVTYQALTRWEAFYAPTLETG